VDLTMTKEERAAFLGSTPRVGVLSIAAPRRGPVSSPLWFVLEPELGEVYFQGVKDEPNVTFVLRPQRWATLDYNKLFA
jgi:hypothetical protein